MKKILFFAFLIGLTFNNSISQDSATHKEKKFKERVDKIINDVFKQIENELGTNIYSEEDTTTEDEFSEMELDSDLDFNRSENYSLYAFPRNKKIPRNNSTAFVIENLDEKFLFRYNRVEGIFIGLQSPHKYFWNLDRRFTIFGSIGYGFGVHKWQYNAGIAHQIIFNRNLFETGIEAHNLVDSRDHWLVGNLENTLSNLFFKYDYKDYFLRKGFSIWLSYNIKNHIADLQTKISYNNDDFTSFQQNVNWSVFRSKQHYRSNPEISEKNLKGIALLFSVHKLDNVKSNMAGWSASLNAEFFGKTFGGDADFNRYIIDLRRYQPISKYDNINLRLRAATSKGELPLQHKYELGGISTLPAYSYKELTGNRLLLANVEYVVNGSMFSEETSFPLSILDNFNLIIFYDIGYIANSLENKLLTDGFENLKFNSLKSDWGFGIGSSDGKYRLSFAWKTDRKSSANVFLRISRPF